MTVTPHPSKVDSRFSNQLAFILSTAGSAIGLANIWKFPYIVGSNGGGTFIVLYLLFLILLGYPALLSEIMLGKTTQERPEKAFLSIGQTKFWGYIGKLAVLTGFLVSSFYSVVAGWIVGYFFEAITGSLSTIQTVSQAHTHFTERLTNPSWNLTFHLLFMSFCGLFLLGGIKRGIEICNKIFMPIFFVILLGMAFFAAYLPDSKHISRFLFSFDFKFLRPQAIIIALGHAFFTLSVGQGTLITYGSYLSPKEPVLKSSFWVAFCDTCVSLISAFTILSILFSANTHPNVGPALIFETLPVIFLKLPFSFIISCLFFFLVTIAAITSQISALEPAIRYLEEKFAIKRKNATVTILMLSFLLGIPSALSYSICKDLMVFNITFVEFMNSLTTSFLIPLCGLASLVLLSWRWGTHNAINALEKKERMVIQNKKWLQFYVTIALRYTAPALLIFIFLHSIVELCFRK